MLQTYRRRSGQVSWLQLDRVDRKQFSENMSSPPLDESSHIEVHGPNLAMR